MALDINIFYSHNLHDRLAIVNAQGELITRIKYYGFYINLYIVNRSFVEVFYNAYTGKIEEVEILDATDERLYLYSTAVDLSDLYRK